MTNKQQLNENYGLKALKIAAFIFAILIIQSTAKAQTALEQQCYNDVQGKVAWNQAGATGWSEANVRSLCQGTTNPSRTIACFQNEIRTHNDWSRGIAACKPKTTPAPSAANTNNSSNQSYQKYVTAEPRKDDFFPRAELQIRAGASPGEINASTKAELDSLIRTGGNEKSLPFPVDENYPAFYFIPPDKRPGILNQGSCGSCTAWASSTALASVLANEGKYKLITRLHMPNPIIFFLTNGRLCPRGFSNTGWHLAPGVKTLAENGTFMAMVTAESTAGGFGASPTANVGDWQVKAEKWGSLTDHHAMRKFIATKGALVADFEFAEDFNKYGSGVYNHEEFVNKIVKPLEMAKQQAAADQLRRTLKTYAGAHAVTVVGYFKGGTLKLRDFMKPILPPGADLTPYGNIELPFFPPFWIVQNSWGKEWGMNGYFYFAADQQYQIYNSTNPLTKQPALGKANTLDDRMFYFLQPKVTSGGKEIL